MKEANRDVPLPSCRLLLSGIAPPPPFFPGRAMSDAACRPGARLSLTVERGAAVASVNLIVQGQ